MTYFEKHRGDETPSSRVSAHDDFTTSAPTLGDDESPEDQNKDCDAVVAAVPPDGQVRGFRPDIVSASLKVYQVDQEVGLLFVLKESELLVTFKLLTNLSRVDRCTGRNYAELHGRQSNVLSAKRRFRKCQRLHTSDGDQTQSLAERALTVRFSSDPIYPVPTLRPQCQIHRVYHVLTIAFAIAQSYFTGQIRMALSLRGPGYFLQLVTRAL